MPEVLYPVHRGVAFVPVRYDLFLEDMRGLSCRD